MICWRDRMRVAVVVRSCSRRPCCWGCCCCGGGSATLRTLHTAHALLTRGSVRSVDRIDTRLACTAIVTGCMADPQHWPGWAAPYLGCRGCRHRTTCVCWSRCQLSITAVAVALCTLHFRRCCCRWLRVWPCSNEGRHEHGSRILWGLGTARVVYNRCPACSAPAVQHDQCERRRRLWQHISHIPACHQTQVADTRTSACFWSCRVANSVMKVTDSSRDSWAAAFAKRRPLCALTSASARTYI